MAAILNILVEFFIVLIIFHDSIGTTPIDAILSIMLFATCLFLFCLFTRHSGMFKQRPRLAHSVAIVEQRFIRIMVPILILAQAALVAICYLSQGLPCGHFAPHRNGRYMHVNLYVLILFFNQINVHDYCQHSAHLALHWLIGLMHVLNYCNTSCDSETIAWLMRTIIFKILLIAATLAAVLLKIVGIVRHMYTKGMHAAV